MWNNWCLKGLLIVGIFGWSSCLLYGEDSSSYTLIKDRAKIPLLTPTFFERKTLKIRLKNGLEAYLISDPLAAKSGAALSVKVGSWEDPKEYPGIAHFLEHMLFLGTKKYPIESEYSRFISENGGTYNAFTANNATGYLFTINNPAFDQAVDRFVQFFKEPLFNPSGVERELKAIDQEYAKNLENDDFRFLFVRKALQNPEHPNSKFNIGNSETLKNVTRETLISWYQTHYSANLMKLILYSNQPLEKLTQLAVQNFSDIPNLRKIPFSTVLPAFLPANRGKMIYEEPLKNLRSITLLWELPAKFAEMQDGKPEDIVCFILGHEGQKSLLAQLKREKLAEGLRCGGVKSGEKLFEFYLEVDLTQEGLQKINTVILRCFQAIATLAAKGVPEYIFDEVKRSETLNYQYQSREDEFLQLMQHIQWIIHEPLETYPEKSQIITSYQPDLIQEFLSALTPENCEMHVIAPSEETQVPPDQKEKWLGAPFAIRSIPEEVLKEWKDAEPHPAIEAPEPNPFIPHHLGIQNPKVKLQDSAYLPQPTKILDNQKATVYFAPDERYQEPKVYWFFQFRTPEVMMDDPVKIAMADLAVKSVTETLNPLSYTAKLAGLNYTINQEWNGISVTLDGYSENALKLFETILDALKNGQTTKENFNLYKDMLLRQYLNFNCEMPIKQAFEWLKEVLYKSFTMQKQKAAAIQNVTYEQFNAYRKKLFEQVFIEGVLYGNMSLGEAEKCARTVSEQFSGETYLKNERPEVEVIALSNQEGPFYIDCETSSQGNAVILAIESEPFSLTSRAAQQVLMQSMKESFFSTLRTKQQTGYIVSSSAEEIKHHLFNFFAVQSNTHNPRDLLARFELFIEDFLQELKRSELREEQFLAIKSSLLADLQEPPKSLVEMGKVLKWMVTDYQADFQWIDKRIHALQALTYEECLDYANSVLSKKNKRRLGILLKGAQPDGSILDYKPISSVKELKQQSTYTSAEEAL
ncbi:insulinase family protein [Parachlamydia sp. AcF125]|uniref:insulinase family protein n=1 Tax=Parachlamydia sp. AcF125 TaxID=2795736 RepID=UPI001BC98FB7|nr:insulinase family protein [Parachlamydia sp. AcF125]MBS4167934.1 Protease 3 [Parachlamydia sp. AcF125]